jgi:hypothetical protein
MVDIKEVPALILHADCIIPYAKRHSKPYGEWRGVKVSELAKEQFTIYVIIFERIPHNES